VIFVTVLAIAAADFYTGGEGKQDSVRVPQNLGTYGETFPVQERSLLEVIREKLQALAESGKLKDHQAIIAKQAREQLNRPPAVRNLQKTTRPRSFAYDPAVTVPYDLKDHEGRVFHPKGTRVNPLDTHSFRYPFLFVDGDDDSQVAWAIQQYKAAKEVSKPRIVLVQGTPVELSRKLGLPVYFDQSGVLVKKFGIAQVPARVAQKEKMLVVEETDPNTEPDLRDTREPE
jgi:conjugal transfer pilus assembly protein TraW